MKQKSVKRKLCNNSKNKKMKKKQKRPISKESRSTKNSLKSMRWDSMENVKPTFSREQAVKCHSDESEEVKDKKTPGP
ncbi:hypothetical protein QQF64_029523 [Cirrhinus molitorella]|uniref:Uncharacterized protein n=1 Tax=Cirrhinus molitorella TaxID=172907 RepID=A0ABR3N114_9TELE